MRKRSGLFQTVSDNWLGYSRGAVGVALLLLIVGGCGPTKNNQDDPRPNVLFIAVDDLNDWIQLLDSAAPIKTPNLKRLAERGTLFTKAYCASPACNPSRTAVLTGIMPSTSGVYGNKTDWRGALPQAVTIPEHFKAHGYHTVGAGKIFHHHLAGAFHDDDSFDAFQKMPDPPDHPMPSTKLNGLAWFGSPNSDWGVWPKEAASKHVDIRTVQYVTEELMKEHEAPFFLAAGIFRPHMPFFTPAEYFDMYPLEEVVMPEVVHDDWADLPSGAEKLLRKTKWFFQGITRADQERPGTWKEAVRAYQASATFADAQVGKILDALDQSRYHDNTIFVLWSDHGYHLGEKEHWEKFALWEKTTHVPLIISAPGITQPGTVCAEPVSLIDIYPTLIDLCGLRPNSQIEGASLLPNLENPGASRTRPAIMTYEKDNHAVRKGRWRYIRYADGTEELYDLRKDANEWTNLAKDASMRGVMDSLKHLLPTHNAPGFRDLKINKESDKQVK